VVNAVVVLKQGATPEVCEIDLPALGGGDIRVRIAAAGVCHSDLSMVNGTVVSQFPLVLGHEASGVVTEVGTDVRDVRVGDKVVLNWAPACRTCWFCLHAEPWLCSAAEGVVSRAGGRLADGGPLNRALGVGAFAEETVVPRRFVVPLPDGVPLDVGALLGCAVLTGMGAVRNTADVRSGDSVLVLGLGGIGLSAVAGARIAGAGPIIAADVAADKEHLARTMGATHFLLSDENLPKRVRALTEGRGADHTFECVGASPTIRLAWKAARRGGNCMVVGVGRRTDEVTFNAMELFHFSRNLTSSIYGSCDPERDLPVLANQMRMGRLDLARMVTHRIDLSGVPAAFNRMLAGEGGRSLIDLNG
jgi:S-(hydroxymethyl)glutathione dehydrogenase/alcohol dehydrogenase